MKMVRGVTLIELMVTIVVLTVLIGIGYPGMQWLIARNNTSSDVNGLVSGLSMARTEAIRRGRSVVITPVDGDWQNGWVIHPAGASIDEPLLMSGPMSARAALAVIQGPSGALEFNSRGSLQIDDQDDEPIIRYAFDPDSERVRPREIRVSRMGQARSCIVEEGSSCW